METEYEVKPLKNIKKEQFEKMATEMLENWAHYKTLRARMELLDASTKKYMLDNDMDEYKCEKGKLTMVEQNRRVLDRSLIDDIEKYKIDSKVKMCFKSPK